MPSPFSPRTRGTAVQRLLWHKLWVGCWEKQKHPHTTHLGDQKQAEQLSERAVSPDLSSYFFTFCRQSSAAQRPVAFSLHASLFLTTRCLSLALRPGCWHQENLQAQKEGWATGVQESTLHTGGSRFLRAWGFLHRIAHLSLEGWLTASYLTFILLKQDMRRLVLNCTAVAIKEPAFLIREKQASPSYSKTGQQIHRNIKNGHFAFNKETLHPPHLWQFWHS